MTRTPCPLVEDCLRRASEAEVILVHLERRAQELGDTAAGREVASLLRMFRAGQHRVGSVT